MTLFSSKSPDTYNLSLPKNLPPTFKGRTFRFSYEFTIGVCRAGASLGNSSANHSRVMKIPVRVYNHVNGQQGLRRRCFVTDTFFCSVMDPPSPYDLLWPVQYAMFPHQVAKPTIVEGPQALKNPFQLKPPSRETQIRRSREPRSPHPSSQNRRISELCPSIRQVSAVHVARSRSRRPGRRRC